MILIILCSFLSVLQPPPDLQHTVSPKTRLIAVGESVNFTCEVNKNGQQVTLKWYKKINSNDDFSPVATSQVDEQRTNSKVVLVLMITKATASNQERDVFKCELTYGSNTLKNKYVALTIRGKIIKNTIGSLVYKSNLFYLPEK